MHKFTILFFIAGLCCFSSCQKESESTATDKPETIPVTKKKKDLPNIPMDEVVGKFEPSKHNKFVLIDEAYADRKGMYLREEAYVAFKKMHEAAKSDGVTLTIRSATRNFYRQKEIWEGKWTGKTLVENGENLAKTTESPIGRALKILQWSSMPGSSRHHWGTDIDLNSFVNSYFESGKGKKVYDWLTKNAALYGFCQPYSKRGNERPYGYNEEKWHWSYLPIAKDFYDVAEELMTNEDFSGFLGSETATVVDIKHKFILSVSQACKAHQ